MESPRHTPQAEGRGAPRFGSGLAARRRRAVPAGGFPHRLGAARAGYPRKNTAPFGTPKRQKRLPGFRSCICETGRRFAMPVCRSGGSAAKGRGFGFIVRFARRRHSALGAPPSGLGRLRPAPPRRLRRGLEVGVAPSAACGACRRVRLPRRRRLPAPACGADGAGACPSRPWPLPPAFWRRAGRPGRRPACAATATAWAVARPRLPRPVARPAGRPVRRRPRARSCGCAACAARRDGARSAPRRPPARRLPRLWRRVAHLGQLRVVVPAQVKRAVRQRELDLGALGDGVVFDGDAVARPASGSPCRSWA